MIVAYPHPALEAGAARGRLQPMASAAHEDTLTHRKLCKAAQEFEGILISKLGEEFQLGFTALPGGTAMAGSDTLNALALQTLSATLARHGGLGIARMLVRQLEPGLNRGQTHQTEKKIRMAS